MQVQKKKVSRVAFTTLGAVLGGKLPVKAEVKAKAEVGDPEAAKILRESMAIIKKRWTQNEFGIAGGYVCALGAIGEVAIGDADFFNPIERDTDLRKVPASKKAVGRRARHFLSRAVGRGIASFNDQESTTQEKVLAKFKKALALAEAKE